MPDDSVKDFFLPLLDDEISRRIIDLISRGFDNESILKILILGEQE